MRKPPSLEKRDFLLLRVEQLIKEGCYDAARGLIRAVDEEQAERFRRLLRLRARIAN